MKQKCVHIPLMIQFEQSEFEQKIILNHVSLPPRKPHPLWPVHLPLHNPHRTAPIVNCALHLHILHSCRSIPLFSFLRPRSPLRSRQADGNRKADHYHEDGEDDKYCSAGSSAESFIRRRLSGLGLIIGICTCWEVWG
jgi:hypothetical protein